MFKPGDIVVAQQGAPYSITKAGTKWMVYHVYKDDEGYLCLRISDIPKSGAEFRTIQPYMNDSVHSRIVRKRAGIRTFDVLAAHFKKDTGHYRNRKYAKKVLKQGDIWEEKDPFGEFRLPDLPF